MMAMNMIMGLPSTSFVPVETRRLRAPKIQWANSSHIDTRSISEFFCCAPQPYEQLTEYTDSRRVLWADLYGGSGLGGAGGSGRCAADGDIQVKGVGRTSLVAVDADQAHSSGTMTLAEAASEVIWSEILGQVLPYGAVKSLAIVTTGGTYIKDNKVRQRTLLLREFVHRPAHYLANLHFRLSSRGEGLSGDAWVKRAALRTLDARFSDIFGDELNGLHGGARIGQGLRIAARRFASQIGASFAKRIFHGGLSCSNISLDGRMLDFGTASHLPRYQRQVRAPGTPDQWQQHRALEQTLRNLHGQVNKYLCPGKDDFLSEQDLADEFNDSLICTVKTSLLKITGMPAGLGDVHPAEFSSLYASMRELYERGAHEPFCTTPGKSPTAGPNTTLALGGRYDLNRILLLAATSTDSRRVQALESEIDDKHLLAKFARAYYQCLHAWLAKQAPEQRDAARIWLALQAIRLNSDLSFLIRGNTTGTTAGSLNLHLAAYDRETDGLAEFIDTTVQRAVYFLDDKHAEFPAGDIPFQISYLYNMSGELPSFAERLALRTTSDAALLGGLRDLVDQINCTCQK